MSPTTVNTMSHKVASLEKIVSQLQKQNQELTRAISRPIDVLPSPTNTTSLYSNRASSDQPTDTSSRPAPCSSAFPSVTEFNLHHGNNAPPDRENQGRIVEVASSPTIDSFLPIETLKSGWVPPSQSDDLDSVIVSALHTRVSNSIHGRTSAFHPQSFLSMPAASSNDAGQQGRPLSEETQSSRAVDEDDLRSQLFHFAASEKQNEHIYGVKGQYDLDSVDYDAAMHLLELH